MYEPFEDIQESCGSTRNVRMFSRMVSHGPDLVPDGPHMVPDGPSMVPDGP